MPRTSPHIPRIPEKRVIFIASLFLIPLLTAGESTGGGKYAGAFLDLGVGARALGLGGAFVGVADDGSAFYWNPAGLSLLSSAEIDFMYATAFGTIADPLANFNHVGFALPMIGGATISANYIRLSIDDIPIFPELSGESIGQRLRDAKLRPDGEPLGYFDDREEAYFFSFAKMNRFLMSLGWQYLDFPVEIPIGINFKLVRQKLQDYSASGFGVDLGMMLRFGLDDLFEQTYLGDLSFGMALTDIAGTSLTWSTQHEDRIEDNFRLGISYLQPLPLWGSTVLLCWGRDSKWGGNNRYGMEYRLRGLSMRVGTEAGNLSAGAGFSFWRFSLGYAYVSSDLGNVHRLSGTFLLRL